MTVLSNTEGKDVAELSKSRSTEKGRKSGFAV